MTAGQRPPSSPRGLSWFLSFDLTGQMPHMALCCLEGSTPKDGFFFYHGLNGLNEVVLWRKEEIKKFVAFPGLTPLQPDAYAQPSKRASLSDHPHPSSLPTGRQESIKTK